MLMTATMLAVPVKPGMKKKVKQVDGSVIELTMYGDEHYSFYKDATGAPFQIVNGLAKKITPEEVTTTWTERKKANLNRGTVNSRRANRIGEPSKSTTGTHKGLVILLEFKDVKFSVPNVKETYQRVFNEPGYNEEGMAGSVRDYFLKQSYKQLTIDFDVVGPYTAEYDLEHYGAPVMENGEEKKHDKDAQLAMSEAVLHAISEPSLNFADYDWDGDGEVDQVFIVFAGYSQAQGADANCIWPHESNLKGWGYNLAGKDNNGNDVAIGTYGCASELMNASGKDMDGIGTACHEFSHCLGLPDMYDTDYSGGYGMSVWDVMDSGSYLDNSRTPSGYTSYERWFSGWMKPKEIKDLTHITKMKPLATEPEAYVLYNDAMEKSIKGEYYLLENRQPVDFDAKLYGHGLLILHVDYKKSVWETNTVNDNPDHQRLTVIPADNNLTRKGWEGDPWPGTADNTQLTNYSVPAATLFNENVDGQLFMSKRIDNITEDMENNTISFVACRSEISAPAIDKVTEKVEGNSVTITWPKVKGAEGYEVEWTAKDKAPSTPDDALLIEYDLAKFEGKETYTPIDGKLDDYGLKNWTGDNIFITPQKMRFGTSTTKGELYSPWWYTPSSTHATLVLGTNIVKKSVKGTVSYFDGDVDVDGERVINIEEVGVADFEVTGDQKLVVHLQNMNKAAYRFFITPNDQMYLNYIAIYDGIWTAKQLGLGAASQVSRRASTTDLRQTTTNSITFKDLDAKKVYFYRIRSLQKEGSSFVWFEWSNEKSFDLEATGIQSISTKVDNDNSVRYFNLQGQEVNGTVKGLVIRKQGSETKKVIMK